MGLGDLVERAKAAVRAGNPREALRILERLEAARPGEAVWPRRQADIYRRLGERDAELDALVRVSQRQVDAGEVVQAIATCKQILEIDPRDTETLDRIHLLYMVPQDEGAGSASEPTAVDLSEEVASPVSPEAPLGELLLTKALPGSRAMHLSQPDLGGVAEIPLDATDDVSQELDLNLTALDARDPFRSPSEGAPRPSRGAGTRLAGESTESNMLKSALLGSLDPKAIRDLLLDVDMVDIEAGGVLFQQGDRADRLYVVVEGAVVPIAEAESRVRMGVLEPGDFFGEIGLLSDQPRNATVEALVDTRLLAIDRPLVWSLLKRHPAVLRVLLQTLRERLVDRQIRTSPLFAAFAAAKRSAVSKQFQMLEVRPDTVLLEQGLADQGLFVVLSGSLAVEQQGVDGSKTLAELRHGDVFGEMSLLFDAPANARVVSSSKCWLLFLSHLRFRKIADSNPGLVEFIRQVAESRYQENWERTASPSREQSAIEPFEMKRR